VSRLQAGGRGQSRQTVGFPHDQSHLLGQLMFRDEDAGRFLFHYTTLEAFVGHILPARRLRFSPFSELNDPRESKEWLCSLSVDEAEARDWNVLEISEAFTRSLKGSTKVLCLTRDDPALHPNRLAHLYGRGYAHTRMWDRYAGNHTGVCLALNIDTLGEDITESLAGTGELVSMAVTYSDMPSAEVDAFFLKTSAIASLGLEEALRTHRSAHYGTLYFFKSSDWASEFEYRWVLLSDTDAKYQFVDIRRSLAGVIFGADYPEESIPMVRDVLGDESVVLSRMWYRNGHPIPVPALPSG
jgi:hypothetical protein